jgi:hypothetical protein
VTDATKGLKIVRVEMPLLKQNIINEFEPWFDSESPNFISFPETFLEAAEKWSDGINVYATNVVPVSSSGNIARTAFFSIMSTMTNANGITLFPQAFAAYATQLAVGMAGYSATPPPMPIDFSPVYSLGLAGGKSADCLSLLADIIDIWFHTGIAVQISSGISQPWS